jgi:glycosyltransferase involved in cell wall biosynthesis
MRAHLALLRDIPWRYLAIVAYILVKRRHLSTVKHFVRSGWLARDLQAGGVTHLHAHFAHGPASVAHFVYLLQGLSYSFTAHAKDIYTSPPDLLAVKMQAARFVVTCTGYNARHLAGLVGPRTARRIHRIYHGVDLHKFQANGAASTNRAGSPPTILAVGRLVEKKGMGYLVEAFRLLLESGYDARLQIVGSGELKDVLKEQIAGAGLQQRVALLGARPQEELIELYHQATIFALPCIVAENGDRDGIPNVLVEAMRCGLPVISTDVSGIPELVVDGQTGVVVPPRDAAALTTALARLLDEPALRARLAVGAAHHVTAEFDLAANATRLKALLLEGR